jgi:hypothetical protein
MEPSVLEALPPKSDGHGKVVPDSVPERAVVVETVNVENAAQSALLPLPDSNLNAIPIVQQVSTLSSSIDSVPPGFHRRGQAYEEPSYSSNSRPPSLSTIHVDLVNGAAMVASSKPVVCTNDLEEGEFTPVLSKKSKKLIQQADKTKVKAVGRKTAVRALHHKGAKHKLF